MKAFIVACAVVLAVPAPTCLAETVSRTGEVRGIYTRLAGGVMLQARSDRAPAGPLYADVALDSPLPNGRNSVIARIESNLRLHDGDPVLVQLDTGSRREVIARNGFAFIAQEPHVLGLVAAVQASRPFPFTTLSDSASVPAVGRKAVTFLQ